MYGFYGCFFLNIDYLFVYILIEIIYFHPPKVLEHPYNHSFKLCICTLVASFHLIIFLLIYLVISFGTFFVSQAQDISHSLQGSGGQIKESPIGSQTLCSGLRQ